jgi:hypothetical protein
MDKAGPATGHAGRANEVVEELIALWQKLLGGNGESPDAINANSNFFVHGGHSLLGIALLGQVEDVVGVELRLVDLFACPTPARLAVRIMAAPPQGRQDMPSKA